MSDPQSTREKIVMVVGAEPRLAARLLQTANSAAFNPSGKPLTDLRSAIIRLGHQLVQSAAMAFAVQQLKADRNLRPIAKPLSKLWETSIAVASISQVLARRTNVRPDEAFLTGLLHGIGRLYIMVRATGTPNGPTYDALVDFIADWHPSIGKVVLENWGFVEEMADAVGNQADHAYRARRAPNLTVILIAAVLLAEALQDGKRGLARCASVPAFAALHLGEKECIDILRHAHHQLGSLHDALGC